MNPKEAVRALGALAQETRLAAYRQLVQAGAMGRSAGDIAGSLDVPAPTMSFHLSQLANAGLISQRREGRLIFYVADYSRMNDLLGFLTDNCCGSGQSALAASCAAPCPEGDRPIASVVSLLEAVPDNHPDPQRGAFAKEDGERVVDENGRRLI